MLSSKQERRRADKTEDRIDRRRNLAEARPDGESDDAEKDDDSIIKKNDRAFFRFLGGGRAGPTAPHRLTESWRAYIPSEATERASANPSFGEMDFGPLDRSVPA